MIKRLAACVREYKLPAFLTPLFVIIETVLEVFIPLVMAELIDNGIYKGDMNAVVTTGIKLIILTCLTMLFGVAAGFTASHASAGFAANLRHDMFKNVQDFSFFNIDRFSTASIVTRLTTDVSNVQMAFQMITRVTVRSPAMLIFAFVSAFNIHSGLSCIYLCVIPFLAVGLFFIIKAAFPRFQRVFKTYDRLNSVVEENLRGMRVVKSFVQEDHEIGKFGKISDSIYKDFSKAEKTVAFNAPLMQVAIYVCMVLVSWLGAQAIVSSGNDAALGLTTGELMSLFTYSMQILMSLMMLSMIFVMLTMSKASANRIVEVLEEKSDITDGERALSEVRDGSIEFRNVCFRYSEKAEKNALDGISIKIASGETIGIIGGTGSSKSTFVQMIPRLYDTTEGEVLVGGENVRDYTLEALRNDVAMVLQKNVLFSGTIKENLRWGDENATDQQIQHACELACADEFIQGFPEKYDTYIEQGGANVSGGQKQRLCIARALLKKPKILILDDSTSAVDTKTDAMIRKAFREEIPDTTKLIIAQRISSVQDADRIIVLDNGAIESVGTHEELLETSPIYREVYESQMKGAEEE
ncbi:MAG: ABC transporter ATP-binding protein [Oscillospiraceae bacterium]|nr:ABC transporter ATP-binding protein [Oscillospiraceae bacterium]